jgi:GMP synthase-like glutamine amidotransferase
MMKIGILQCGHAADEVQPTHGDYDAMFRRLLGGNDFDFQTFNVDRMEFPASVHDCDGWLLTGSRHGVYEGHAFIPPLGEFIRTSYAESVPMVGICFGHQIIAQALGGRVEKFKGGWAVGRHTYTFDDHGTVALNAWHQDQVTVAPKEAKRIATSDFCENAALVYGKKALTIQAHPEFTNPLVADYIELRKTNPAYPADLLEQAKPFTEVPVDAAVMGKTIADFFRNSGKHHG